MAMIEILKGIAAHWALTGGLLVLVAALVWLAVTLGPAWLLAHWAVVADAVVVFVAAAVILWLNVLLEQQVATTVKAQADYRVAVGQERILQATNADLSATIIRQSKAATDAQSESATRAKAASEAMAAAKAKQSGDQAVIAKLRARAANPQTNQGTCDDEIANLRAAL
jgi:hypothetical protein